MAMVTGQTTLVTRGQGFSMPSLLMGEAQAVTPTTAARQASELPHTRVLLAGRTTGGAALLSSPSPRA